MISLGSFITIDATQQKLESKVKAFKRINGKGFELILMNFKLDDSDQIFFFDLKRMLKL